MGVYFTFSAVVQIRFYDIVGASMFSIFFKLKFLILTKSYFFTIIYRAVVHKIKGGERCHNATQVR